MNQTTFLNCLAGICLFILLSPQKLSAQPNSFSTTINEPSRGDLTFQLYKYNVRSPDLEIYTYHSGVLTPYTPGQARTYRGSIDSDPNAKVFSWFRNGFGALSHEFGHTLNLAHSHNQRDAMHANMFYYGRNSQKITTEHLLLDGNLCLQTGTTAYTDPVHPYAAEDYIITQVNTPIEIDVLANDKDFNDDALSILDFETTSLAGVTISLVGDKLLYTPIAGFKGKDYFNYRVQSGNVGDGTYFFNDNQVLVDVWEEGLALHYTFDEPNGSVIFDRAWGISQLFEIADGARGSDNEIDYDGGNILRPIYIARRGRKGR